MPDNIARNFKRAAIACAVGVVVFAAAIALSVALALHVSDAGHDHRVDNRVPACQQAHRIIAAQNNGNGVHSAGVALYNATGCPQILREAQASK